MKHILIILLITINIFSQDFDYNLKAKKISKNTYIIEGKKEYFSKKNGGDISNASFIITSEGVIVIDTGTTYAYGKQILKEIRKITTLPIKYVINTHHHPDHFLGNLAFKGLKILSTGYTQNYIEKHGDEYINNLINILLDSMKHTEILVPNEILKDEYIVLGKHKIKVLYMNGHTSNDIVLYDEYTGTLFSSDIVFNNRAAATPHSNIKKWISALKVLKSIDYKVLVPGHGSTSNTKEPIVQTIKYLTYLDELLRKSAQSGLTIYEILQMERPKEFEKIFLLKEEFERSVINLYPSYEDKLVK